MTPWHLGSLAAGLAGSAPVGSIVTGAARSVAAIALTVASMLTPGPAAFPDALPDEGTPAAAAARTVDVGHPCTPPLAGGRLVRPFTPGPLPWSPGHRGVDVAAALPTVRAPCPGIVTFVGTVAGVPVLVIAHRGGVRSTLQPVRAILPVGTRVAAGAPVGVVAAAPDAVATAHLRCPTGTTCLHWGLLRGDVYLDPWRLVQPPVVRLVPDVGPLH